MLYRFTETIALSLALALVLPLAAQTAIKEIEARAAPATDWERDMAKAGLVPEYDFPLLPPDVFQPQRTKHLNHSKRHGQPWQW